MKWTGVNIDELKTFAGESVQFQNNKCILNKDTVVSIGDYIYKSLDGKLHIIKEQYE